MMFQIKAAIAIEFILLIAVVIFRYCLDHRHRANIAAGDVLPIMIIPLVGLFGYDKNVYYAFMFVLPMFWTASPDVLVKRYMLTLLSFPPLGQDYSIAGMYFGGWSALLTLNAGLLIAITIARKKSLRPVRSIDIAIWIIFFCAFLIGARGAIFNGVLRWSITTFFLVIPPYLVVSRLVASRRVAADMIIFFILGGICNACIALFESAKHWSLYESLGASLHVRTTLITTNLAIRAGFLRATGALQSYEALGCVCGLSLLAAIALRRRFNSVGFGVIVLLLTLGLLSSQARAAWLGTGVGLVAQAIYDRRWGRAGAFVGLGGAVAVVASAMSSHAGRVGEMIGTGGNAGSTIEYRQRLFQRGLEEARLHPLTGQTTDQLQVSMNDLRQGEHIIDFVNTHLNVLLVGGVGALAAWLLAWSIPLVLGWRCRSAYRQDSDPVATSLPFAQLSLLLVYLAFTSATDREFPLVAIGMGLMSVGLRFPIAAGGRAAVRRRRADATTAQFSAPKWRGSRQPA